MSVRLRRADKYRLRAALSLTDDQVQHILPRVERFEEQKRLSQREIAESVRRLRRGLDQGATDAELRELLERIDRSEREQWERERLFIAEIGEVLSARQQVQLRFFLQHFRRQIQEKIRELRGDGSRGRPTRRGPRREQP